MRFLIVDDDERFLEAFQQFLWDSGHDAETAKDGLTCQAILRRSTPDVLIIAQCLLCGSEGVFASISENGHLAKLSVIVLANDHDMSFEIRENPHVVAWLQKPFQLSDAMSQIAAAIHIEQRPPRQAFSSRERLSRVSNGV